MSRLLLLLGCLSFTACEKHAVTIPSSAGKSPETISITDFHNEQKVLLGRLGVPFGKIVPVSCRGIEPSETERLTKRQDWKDEIEVVAVDGKAFETPIRLRWSGDHGEVTKPAPGATLLVYGYETGMFAGIPDRLSDYASPWQDTAFHFECTFVALTTNAPETDEP